VGGVDAVDAARGRQWQALNLPGGRNVDLDVVEDRAARGGDDALQTPDLGDSRVGQDADWARTEDVKAPSGGAAAEEASGLVRGGRWSLGDGDVGADAVEDMKDPGLGVPHARRGGGDRDDQSDADRKAAGDEAGLPLAVPHLAPHVGEKEHAASLAAAV
jgi:hypothetical protein